ncbi:MAG: hypothetical protein HQM00_02615 [Magnetococcales bacterium]|nr:hypothetical protein [Magnetococcales bacterium]
MMKKINILFILFFSVTFGCAHQESSGEIKTLITYSEILAKGLLENAEKASQHRPFPILVKNQPILVISLADLNKLESSSNFGRTVGELLSSQFVAHGYLVAEIKATGRILIRKDEGEFSLSREVKSISSQHGAQAIITGTYSVLGDRIYITPKIIDNDGNILSSYSLSIPNRYIKQPSSE